MLLTKLFGLRHGAPVEGEIVGPKAKTLQYCGFGKNIDKRHVDPEILVPGQSYALAEKIHPFAPMGMYGIDEIGIARAWGKVVEVRKKEDQLFATHEVNLRIGDQEITLDVTDLKMCIPNPTSKPSELATATPEVG